MAQAAVAGARLGVVGRQIRAGGRLVECRRARRGRTVEEWQRALSGSAVAVASALSEWSLPPRAADGVFNGSARRKCRLVAAVAPAVAAGLAAGASAQI